MLDTGCCTDKFIQAFIDVDLKLDVYERLLPVLHMNDFNLDIATLTENMIGLMVEIQYFDFTVTRYTYLDDEYHHLAINYIAKNQEAFLEQAEEIKMSSALLKELLSNSSIDDATKQHLFDLFAMEYMSQDIVPYVIEGGFEITKEQFKVTWNYANYEQRDRLFTENYELLNVDDLEKCFNDLNQTYCGFIDRSSRHSAELAESEENLKLAEYLKKVGYITSYEFVYKHRENATPDTHEGYRVIKCRIKQQK